MKINLQWNFLIKEENMKLFLVIIIAIGVTAIYDARKIVKQYFSKQDQNSTVLIIKIAGFVVSVLSGIALVAIK